MKRVLVLLAAILTLAAFAASAAPVTITAWDLPPQGDIYETLQKQFDAKYPNIKVTHMGTPGTGSQDEYVVALAAGRAPEVFGVSFPNTERFAVEGWLEPLERYFNKWAEAKNIIPAALKVAQIGGHLYGLPFDMYVMTFWYRKDLYRDAGLDPTVPPKNWDELVEYSQKLTDPSKNQAGYSLMSYWCSWYWENFVWQAGGDLTVRNPDGTVKLTFAEEPGVTALQFYNDLVFKYQVTPGDILTVDNGREFIAGRLAQYMFASGNVGGMVQAGLKPEDLGIGPLPAGPKAKGAQTGGAYYVMSPKSSAAKKDAAWTYMSFMASKSSMLQVWQDRVKKGIAAPNVSQFKDVNLSDVMQIPKEWGDAVTASGAIGRAEYYLKGKLEPYLDKPIQTALTDAKADAKAMLLDAKTRFENEYLNIYNAQILLKKK